MIPTITKTDTEKFIEDLNIFKGFLQHNIVELLQIWENPKAEQIMVDLGPNAKTIFEWCTIMQGILKQADDNYEYIRPYKKVFNFETKEMEKKFLSITFKEDGSVDSFSEIN